MQLIQIDHLTKIYRASKKENHQIKKAVDNISFKVNENEIFGLLGPNGAGKTTTLRCISTLLKPTEGFVKVNNYDTVKDAKAARKSICFLTNELKLDEHFTPNYTAHFFGKLYNMTEEAITTRRNDLFEKLGIDEFADKRISDLSTGMKQKTSIAVSLIHDPNVIIFDEPTNGLDVITAKTITDYLFDLKKEGKTILLSTHIMTVASKLCDNIAIIINGSIKKLGSLSEILDFTDSKDLEEAFFKLYEEENE